MVAGLLNSNLPQRVSLLFLKATDGLLRVGLRGETRQEGWRGTSPTNSKYLPQGRVAILHPQKAEEEELGAPLKQRAPIPGPP